MKDEQQKECKIDLSSPFAFLLFLKMFADKDKKEQEQITTQNHRKAD